MYRPQRWLIRVIIHVSSTGVQVRRWVHSCQIIVKNPSISAYWFRNQTSMRADPWCLCGDMKLRSVLLPNWQGSCAMAQLLMPFHLFPLGDFKALSEKLSPEELRRLKRSTVPGGSFDNRVYLDSIGVPRGVPNEFKARNQVASGF